jgi:hypothetical protein
VPNCLNCQKSIIFPGLSLQEEYLLCILHFSSTRRLGQTRSCICFLDTTVLYFRSRKKSIVFPRFSLQEENTGLFKKKYTLSKIYFTKTTDVKSMSCVRTEKKSLRVLIINYLKRRITEAVAAVTCDKLRRVWEELEYRFDICRFTRGDHIECL